MKSSEVIILLGTYYCSSLLFQLLLGMQADQEKWISSIITELEN